MTTKATDQDPAAETADTTEAPGTAGAVDQAAGGDGAAAKAEPEEAKAEPEEAKAEPEEAEPEEAKPDQTKAKATATATEDEPAKDAAEDKAGKGESPAAGGRGPLGTPLVYGLVAVTLIAAIVTAVLQWRAADRLDQADATRQAIRTRAGEFGQALLSYDHRNVNAARKRVMSMAADDFARTYDVAFSGSGGLEGVIDKLQADATATVRTVYVSEIDGSNAKAIVVMDSQVKSRAGTRRVLGSYLEMGLTKQKGKWLVRAVSSIGAANESMTGDPATGQDSSGGTGSVLPTGSPSPGN